MPVLIDSRPRIWNGAVPAPWPSGHFAPRAWIQNGSVMPQTFSCTDLGTGCFLPDTIGFLLFADGLYGALFTVGVVFGLLALLLFFLFPFFFDFAIILVLF